MQSIEPSFEIDNKGRVICQSHPNYPFFIMPNKTFFEERKLETILTCKTCSHYLNDDCYFSTSRINEIEQKRLKKAEFLCKLCGNRIDRMLTIVHKLYYKEKHNVNLPLICCNCYESLNKNEYLPRIKWKIYMILVSSFSTIFFIIYFLSFGLIFGTTLSFLLIGFLIWMIFLFRDFRRLKRIISGRKYYKKYFPNKQSINKG